MLGNVRQKYLCLAILLPWVLFLYLMVPHQVHDEEAIADIPYTGRREHVPDTTTRPLELPAPEVSAVGPGDGHVEDEEDDFLRDMSSRSRNLQKVCKANGLDVWPPTGEVNPKGSAQANPAWEYIVDQGLKLVWCPVFKASSSSWVHMFLRLMKFTESDLRKMAKPMITVLRDLHPRPTREELRAALEDDAVSSFLVVRHPLERLISAYRDKIVMAFRGSYHDKMRSDIVRKYRRLSARQSMGVVPTFEEFVSYVLDEAEQGAELDMHWAPIYKFCRPCQFDIKFILKTETMDRDFQGFLRESGVGEQLRALESPFSFDKINSSPGTSTSALMQQHLSNLTTLSRARLTTLYRMDFELFGYLL